MKVEAGEIYELTESWGRLPKGLKVKVLGVYEDSLGDLSWHSSFIEVPMCGIEWRYFNINTWLTRNPQIKVLDMLNNIDDNTKFNFIPNHMLCDINQKVDGIVLFNLSTKWCVSITDIFNSWKT